MLARSKYFICCSRVGFDCREFADHIAQIDKRVIQACTIARLCLFLLAWLSESGLIFLDWTCEKNLFSAWTNDKAWRNTRVVLKPIQLRFRQFSVVLTLTTSTPKLDQIHEAIKLHKVKHWVWVDSQLFKFRRKVKRNMLTHNHTCANLYTYVNVHVNLLWLEKH